MLIVACVLAGLAALLHVWIWWIETFGFMKTGRKVFGLNAEAAANARQWAFNQGFYNLFLAVITVVGIGIGDDTGRALMIAGTGSMLGAALVLVADDRSKARGAVMQGTLPALSLLALLVWCLT